MGCRMGESPSEQLPITAPPPSKDEAVFLYAIFYLIGLPVDVRVWNGSAFSGIFHTASVEARLSKKGKSDTNVAVGCTIETLVIFSDDLVQVVAKGEVVPTSGIGGNSDNDEFRSAWGTFAASHTAAKAGKKSKGFTIGAIELSILANFYGREITAYDIQTTRCDLYDQEMKYNKRVMLIYDRLPYDALIMSPAEGAPEEFDQTIFEVRKDGTIGPVEGLMLNFVKNQHRKRKFTDTANFTLSCGVCQIEVEAVEHAQATGHVNFQEYR